MTPEELKRAVMAAAGAHVARLFDVMCAELSGPTADEAEIGARFMRGVGNVNRAVEIALREGAKS